MSQPSTHTVNLVLTARRAMVEQGFDPDFPAAAREELHGLEQRATAALSAAEAQDLTQLLWSSIDNMESRDLDQIEVAEALPGGAIRVLVGVADVDALVPQGAALDARAKANSTSVYTGVVTFPMLPEVLSTDLTSLNQDADRLAIVTEFVVQKDGSVSSSSIYRARVRNRAQLAYDEIAPFLEGTATAIPPRVARLPGLAEQLKVQDEAAQRLKQRRHEQGALDLDTAEAQTVAKDGEVVGIELAAHSRSRALIEDFMVCANGVMARFLEAAKRPCLMRIVRTPARWDRIVALAAQLGETLPKDPSPSALSAFLTKRRAVDPLHFPDLSLSVVKLLGPGEYVVYTPGHPVEGHFGLAVNDYTHSTAPNRRFADLVTQRLLKAVLAKKPSPYDEGELRQIAQHCTDKAADERKLERFMRKVAAAQLLSRRVGDKFDALVTGVGDKGTFVRLLSPPAEGRVVHGERGLDVGDRVRVQLVATAPERGFIDFARA